MAPKVNPYQAILDGLVTGDLNVDEAEALAGKWPAESRTLLIETIGRFPVASGFVDPRQWPGRVMDLLWRMEGATRCIEHFRPAMKDLREAFYWEKLNKSPADFTYEDLQSLRYDFNNTTLVPSIIKLQAAILKPEARARMGLPAQFASDLTAVKKQISLYSFPAELNELLDKVEDELQKASDPFDRAATLKHLRTFFEKLHQNAAAELHKRKPETEDKTDFKVFGNLIDHLKNKDLIPESMRLMGRGLFAFASNEGAHAVKSETEYVRLCRNMVAEYALVLFFELERRLK